MILSVVEVVIACFLIFGVGYLGLLSVTNQLSDQVRDAVMGGVIVDVNNRMGRPIQAAQHLLYMTEARFSDIETRTMFTNETGFLADIAFLALEFPGMARLGFLTHNNFMMFMQRDAAGTDFTTAQNVQVGIAEAGSRVINATDLFPLNVYLPTVNSARNQRPNVPPLLILPEVRPSDSPARIQRWLGSSPVESDFNLNQLRFLPAILASVANQTLGLTADGEPPIMSAGWSPPITTRDRSVADGSKDFLTLVAFAPAVLTSDPTKFSHAAYVHFKLTDLGTNLARLPFGSRGQCHLVRGGGDIVASSDATLQSLISSTQKAVNLMSSDNPLNRRVGEFLIEWGLIINNSTSQTTVVQIPYTTQQFGASFSSGGHGWRIEAKMLEKETSALPWTLVLLTRDDDFDGGVTSMIRLSSIVSAVICLVAVVVSFMVTRCVSKPLLSVVDFMGRAVKVIRMERGQGQRLALAELCESWSASSGMVMPPLFNASSATAQHNAAVESIANPANPFEKVPLYKSFCWLCTAEGDTCCCYRVGRSLREVQLLHSCFSSMLYTLASYDELDAINQAKRSFIRYIFHEVRVPFNAIVMGSVTQQCTHSDE